jgi:hypothetical protein
LKKIHQKNANWLVFIWNMAVIGVILPSQSSGSDFTKFALSEVHPQDIEIQQKDFPLLLGFTFYSVS